VLGRTILHARFSSARVTRGGFAETAMAVTNATIVAVRRRGKQIFFELDRGGFLYVHLGMTGKLLWDSAASELLEKHVHAVFEFAEGVLRYQDARQFGRVEFYPEMPQAFELRGPDALGVDFETFVTRLKARRGQVKALLLNQAVLSGLGNIYVDELLFASRVHPRTSVQRISRERARLMHQSMLEILKLAIAQKGSSISDYVDASGAPGSYQQQHQVYGKAGEPCPRCGGAIRRVVVAQRGTHYCPRCQRA
jgi:formamidopyrimidine-DNA glycosylase